MKTIYLSALISFLLAGFTSPAQVNEATSTSAGSAPAIAPSAAEAAVLEAASNAVQGATIIWLPDQPVPASQWAPATIQGTVALTDAAATAGVPIQEASSNGQNTVRYVYQTSPAAVAATTSLALGAAQTGNSPQPMDSLGGCVQPGSGLVCWWQAEGDAYDSMGNNSGVLVNGVSFDSGMVGQAFSLNGVNQSVQIPYLAGMATAGFSVEAWVNPAHQIGAQAFVFGQSYGRQLVVSPGSGGLNVAFFVTDTNGAFHGVTSSRVIPLGQWTHLAGTWNGTNLKLYTNGVQDRSASLQLSAIGDSGCPFSIGGINDSCGYYGQYFPGRIDEVSLYNRALFPGEINAIYLAGSGGKCKTPPVCAACPASAVSWWPAEWDASDVVGNNPGTLQNDAFFAAGIVGQAFSFNGSEQAVEIPYSSTLATTAFSVEAWVNPAARVGGALGQAFILGQCYGRQLVVRNGGQGLRVAFVISNNGSTFYEVDSSGDIPLEEWTHLVGIWDGNHLRLFINGALDQQAPVNIVPWDSGCAFHIGGIYDPAGNCAYVGQFFNGLVDETTYYNQALSAADVQALYNAGSMGKCALPPTVVSPPDAQTVTAGNDATLQVSATGSSLSYQWYHNGVAIPGATESTLYLSNVQSGEAGTYTVQVFNSSGSVTSDGAVLTVVAPVPVPTPSGVVAWWRCEGIDNGTVEDTIGNNPAQAEGITSCDPNGKVGYAMPFGGYIDLLIPYKAPEDGGLNSSTWEGFTLEGWIMRTDIPVPPWVANPEVIMEQYDAASHRRITLSISATGPGSLDITYVNSGAPGGTNLLSAPPGTVRPGTFQHVALAYKDHLGDISLKLYLNGRVVASNTGAEAQIALKLGADELHFGQSPSGSIPEGFGGSNGGWMDELTIYNRALEESEILGIYNAGSAGKIPPCTQVPSGCTNWWQGEGNGSDVYALNPAVPAGGVSFTAGETGQAFTFNGPASVRVPASAALNVGTGDGFTLEAWVNPTSVSTAQPILEWNSGYVTGVAIWISGSGYPRANLRDTGLNDNPIASSGQMTAGAFQHIALTYDKTAGNAFLYLNGTEVGELEGLNPAPTPLTSGDLYFGFSPIDDKSVTGTQFAGQIDEVALYSRALSASEVRRLYSAAGGGKCGIAPSLITQPGNQTANVGNNVLFQVLAAGTSLTYQWLFDNAPIAGATGPTLTLMNLLANQAGSYSVRVANTQGSVTTSAAVLTVNPAGQGASPVIQTQPASQTSVCEGGGFTLSVSATGSGSLRYQWCKNGFNINGATSSTFTLSQAAPGDAGTYTVIVYDSLGQVTSADAALTVNPHPTAVLSGDASTFPEEMTPLLVVLTGTGPWDLTWSDGFHQSPVTRSPWVRWVAPVTTTTYTLTAMSDANCAARASDITGSATVTVSGPSEDVPQRVGIQHLTGSRTNVTLAADETFYVDSPVDFYGTTTIEGGTVVKFAPDTPDNLDTRPRIVIHDPSIVCHTGPYRPALFTACDDDSYGYYGVEQADYGVEQADAPAGSYGYGLSLAFPSTANVVLKDLRFFYLGCGISMDGPGSCSLYDCQFIDCNNGVGQTTPNASLNVFNALFWDTTNVFALGPAVQAPQVSFQHLTVDTCQSFVSGLPSGGTWQGANSLLVAVQNASSIPSNLQNIQNTCVILSSAAGLFLNGGDASHYLAGNTYRAHGTTAIDTTLLGELSQKTTSPPLDLPIGFATSGSMTFSAQVPRYTSGSNPDLGYYYDALDYTVAAMTLLDGAQITVLPGTAIGMRCDCFYGFDLSAGTSFISQGTPTRPNTFVPVSLVQEGPFPYSWYPGFVMSFIPDYSPYEASNPDNDPPPTLNFRFSNLYLNSGLSFHLWTGMAIDYFRDFLPGDCTAISSALSLQMRDCSLVSGWLDLGEPNVNVIVPVDYGGQTIPGAVSWVNNLFDRVNINLDPDTGPAYWRGPAGYSAPTIDLSLVATNNLFHGGWLFLEPVAASAGDWVFLNNLFDKTVFGQDQYQPLDYDYNAYWPCVGAELLPGQAGQLTGTAGNPHGANDLVLTAAPPYQSGPLGDFYQAPTSPLIDRGSTTADQLGLYHYTTQVNQTKEQGSTVDIGLHYIALDSTGKPMDSDSDGIPDYVEDANGNGIQDPGETDWTNDYSGPDDPPVEDRYSSVYDDIDLDGDGLTGAAERLLFTNPLVEDNPLDATKIPLPDTVSGLVTIPLNINASVDENLLINLTVNGDPAAAVVHKVNGSWLAEWDTKMLPNGTCYIAFEVVPEDEYSNPVSCPAKFVTVQNDICFPDGLLLAGATLYVNAQTIYANGTWTMDIYDDQGNLFDSLEGDVDANGFCDFPGTSQQGVGISLLDSQGNDLPSEYYTVALTTYAAPSADDAGGSAEVTVTYGVEEQWPGQRPGQWVVAYQPLYGDDDLTLPSMISPYIETPINNDPLYINTALPVGGNRSPVIGSVQQPGGYSVDCLKDDSAWGNFASVYRLYFGNARNLFYFGHCACDVNGGQLGGYGASPQRSIDANRLKAALGNSATGNNNHPYRFVFICGCKSAKTDLPIAFGIPKVTMSSSDFHQKYGLSPRAFLGFNGNMPMKVGVMGQPNGGMDPHLQTFLTNFWILWTTPGPNGRRTLEQAVGVAKAAANKGNGQWWVGQGIRPQIWGCKDLYFDE